MTGNTADWSESPGVLVENQRFSERRTDLSAESPGFATGAGGVQIRYRAEGPPEAPALVFIHGWSQSLDAWDLLFHDDLIERFRLVAYDLRGHGRSGNPVGAESYRDAKVWADDLAAVIDKTCDRSAPIVLVGWSYGGFVVSDYLRHCWSERVRGICYVAASVNLDEDQVPDYLAPVFPPLAERAASADPEEAELAIREFVALCTAQPLDPERFEAIVATNLLTSPEVRAALADRVVRSDDLLAELTIPVLIIQGTDDLIVLPATADYIADRCQHARIVHYQGVGHLPMVEAAERLTADLADFVVHVAAP